MRRHFLFLTALLACVVAGCSEDAGDIEAASSPLEIEASVENASSRAAKEGTSFVSGDMISLFALNSSSSALWSSSEMTATLGASGWTISPTLYLGSDDVQVYGFYPSRTITPSMATLGAMTVYAGQTDYMWGTCALPVNASRTSAKMTFCHALALISFTFTCSNSPESCLLSEIQISDKTSARKIYSSGTMSVVTGAVTGTTGTEVQVAVTDGSFKTSQKTVQVMVLPAEITSGTAKFTFTIDSKAYETEIPAISWQAGKRYSYPVRLSGTALSIGDGSPSDIVITDWTDGGVQSATDL